MSTGAVKMNSRHNILAELRDHADAHPTAWRVAGGKWRSDGINGQLVKIPGPLDAGTTIEIEWDHMGKTCAWFRTPEVELGGNLVFENDMTIWDGAIS